MRYLFLFLLLVSTGTFAQKQDETIYIFNKDWSGAKDLESAVYFMQVIKEHDSLYFSRYYAKEGPMMRQEAYSDADLTIPNGRFVWYNERGDADSTGFVWHGKKDGTWHIYGDSNKVVIIKKYDKGKLLYTEDVSLNKRVYTDGTIETLAARDTTGHVPASFAGGLQGWRKYLERNLQVPARFINLNKIGGADAGVVKILFDVAQDGKVHVEFVLHSCEYSLDKEALRIITTSPKWIPATINGEKVVYRQIQGINFRLQ